MYSFSAGKNFVIGNAQADGIPVIYCTRGICELTGYEKGDFVQKSCALEFLCGPETDPNSVSDVRKALQCEEKREIYPVTYYKKDGMSINLFVIFVVVSDRPKAEYLNARLCMHALNECPDAWFLRSALMHIVMKYLILN